MSSLFNTTQPLTGVNNSNLFGLANNTLTSGLNNQRTYQNVQINNMQHLPVIDSRSTIRQLTTLIPEWKGHFDIADAIMSSQEQMLSNVSVMVSQLNTVFDQFQKTYELTKASMSDINIHQNSLNNEVQERLRHQDMQNLVTIKLRRLCEILISNRPGYDNYSFKVPNHINVQLSRELFEKVKSLKSEIDYIQNEVQMLKEIDLSQVPNFIESVLQTHKNKITILSNKLTNQLNTLDYRTNSAEVSGRCTLGGSDTLKDRFTVGEATGVETEDEIWSAKRRRDTYGYPMSDNVRLWSGISGEPSILRRRFMEGVGVQVDRREPEEPQMSDIKLQISYLRRFNSSYDDPNYPYLRDYGFNIKDLLTATLPVQGVGTSNLFGTSAGTTNNLFGGTTGGFGTTAGGTNLFGGTTGTGSSLFGSTTGTGFGSSSGGTGLFGSTSSNTTGGTGLFGSSSGVTNLFGNTQTGTANQFGSSTPGFGTSTVGAPAQSTTSGSLFGTTTGTGTGLFGTSSTTGNTGTTSGTGLFGSTTNTGFGALNTGTTASTGNLFGSATSTTGYGTSTGSNLFGSSTSTNPTSGIFGNTNTPGFGTSTTNASGGTGLFGSSTSGGFGTTSTGATGGSSLFGGSTSTSAFGSNTGVFGTITGGTNLFGSSSASNTGSSLFGSSTNTGFGNTSTGSAIFGSGSASSSSLFGSSNQQKSTGTELAIYQPTTSFSSFTRK